MSSTNPNKVSIESDWSQDSDDDNPPIYNDGICTASTGYRHPSLCYAPIRKNRPEQLSNSPKISETKK